MTRFLIQGSFYKMDYYGVRGIAHSWIKAFLSNRKQEVVLEGHHSFQADLLSGVPQGTVLGPLLFLAYIIDLPDSLKSSDARLFADDSLLYLTVNGAKRKQPTSGRILNTGGVETSMVDELQPIEVLRHTYHFRQEEEKECLPVYIHTS